MYLKTQRLYNQVIKRLKVESENAIMGGFV
jgi:hypothetical protein